jgi:hypothetical protein
MVDIAFVGIVVAFFLVTGAFMRLLENLQED